MASNKAVIIDKPQPGQKPELVVRDIEVPEIADDEVLVKMRLRPVNPSDVASTSLIYPGFNRAKNFPAVLGLEGVGAVEKTGSQATKLKTGQRVVAVSWGADKGSGTWQQYKAMKEASLIPVHDSVSDESAAQFLVNPCTAVGFLQVLQIPKGGYFMQSAATSELGRMMIQLCKHRGLKTINVVRRKDAIEELKAAGADIVLSTDEVDDLAKEVKELTGGEMAYGAVDAVAGDLTAKLASCVRPGGKVLVFGAMGGVIMDGFQLRDLLFRGVSVTGFWMATYLTQISKEALSELVSEVMDLFVQGVFKPRAGPKFPLDQVKEAIAASLETAKAGKVFLEG